MNNMPTHLIVLYFASWAASLLFGLKGHTGLQVLGMLVGLGLLAYVLLQLWQDRFGKFKPSSRRFT